MGEAIVTGLFRYPIKGCRSVPVDTVDINASGIEGDRELAIVSDDGRPLDQVTRPKLARIGVDVRDDGSLVLSHPEAGLFEHRPRHTGERVAVAVTLDEADAQDQGDEVAAWFSQAVGEPVRVVRADRGWNRTLPLDQFALIDGEPVDRFTSVAPILLGNQASLDDLNARLDVPVPMNRFRCNVVVAGLDAFVEDAVTTMVGSAVTLRRVTACERCAIITTDQRTGERPSAQVLRVLEDYRRKAHDRYTNGLIFGAYMAVPGPGRLRVGERLSVEVDPDFVPLTRPPLEETAS